MSVKNKVHSFVEYLLCVFFLSASVATFGYDSQNVDGILGYLFQGEAALLVYSVWFAFLGLMLLVSKTRKLRKTHSVALFCMYLTGMMSLLLTLSLFGPTLGMMDDLVIVVLAAACWLRWNNRRKYSGDNMLKPARRGRHRARNAGQLFRAYLVHV